MSPDDLNLTRTQRYSSSICHNAAASQSLDPSEQRNSLERQEINLSNNGYKQKQKGFRTSHDRFWNVERMFFLVLILLVFIILRAEERRSLLKGVRLYYQLSKA